MGKSAANMLSSANAMADEKARLEKRKMLTPELRDKLNKGINKRVASAITVMNRRPKKAQQSSTSGGFFTTTSFNIR